MERRELTRSAKATIVSASIAFGLLAVAWVIVLNLPDSRPPTIDAAEAAVMPTVDRIHEALPAEMVVGVDESAEEGLCTSDDGARRVQVRREIKVSPDLDRVAWTTELRGLFDAEEGWRTRVGRPTGGDTDDMRLDLVDAQLRAWAVVATDEDGPPRVTILATSACAQPPT